jgi:predicted RNA-binding Zn-ribbon protein involved in translation (DUF1610 family)
MEVREPRPRDQWAIAGWLLLVLGFVGLAVFVDVHFDLGAAALLLIVPGVWLLLQWMARAWAYRCPNCGEVFQLSPLGQFTAVNMGDERNVKCPSCGKRSWMKILRRIR